MGLAILFIVRYRERLKQLNLYGRMDGRNRRRVRVSRFFYFFSVSIGVKRLIAGAVQYAEWFEIRRNERFVYKFLRKFSRRSSLSD